MYYNDTELANIIAMQICLGVTVRNLSAIVELDFNCFRYVQMSYF